MSVIFPSLCLLILHRTEIQYTTASTGGDITTCEQGTDNVMSSYATPNHALQEREVGQIQREGNKPHRWLLAPTLEPPHGTLRRPKPASLRTEADDDRSTDCSRIAGWRWVGLGRSRGR